VLRRDQRRTDREAEHGRELTESVHAWMEPDLAHEAGDLDDLERAAIAGLPLEVLETYELVRDGGASYERAAREMGVGRTTVAVRVARVRDALERALLARENGRKNPVVAEREAAEVEVEVPPEPTAEELVQRAFVRAIAYFRDELARRGPQI
jgi:DNA-directed RNA polymerase specialized sigma24 family protein